MTETQKLVAMYGAEIIANQIMLFMEIPLEKKDEQSR